MTDSEQVACRVCGTTRTFADPLRALAWVRENENDGARWLCPECAGRHVRDIESKLPTDYW
ncbi:hypothetical protein B0I33_11415 [Prauserella shujinwangii]|uniref:Small CPxCG-related zinc finger protein n=1 Tax=Prauserella shujinwangii TaxID=1453103 RepID=A0A2T0LKT3_9PSEU|nr:hypothetical protein [Prauserella shujinwangii]PRX43558.1 hypothetical protein B0I33_11415 [Prauserella shujinwangii]